MGTLWVPWDPIWLHLNYKDLKLGQKWMSYNQFTYERLHDSNEYHVGCFGSILATCDPEKYKIKPDIASIRASFESKSYETGPEMAQLQPIH